jgi:hypothetical protein
MLPTKALHDLYKDSCFKRTMQSYAVAGQGHFHGRRHTPLDHASTIVSLLHYFIIVSLASMRQCIDCSCHTSFNHQRRVTNRRSESASLMTPTNNNKHNMERKINMMSKQQKYGAKCMFLINKDYYFYNEAN